MISLKKYLESDREEMLNAALEIYRQALLAVGGSGVQACPSIGVELKSNLLKLEDQFTATKSPDQLRKSGALANTEIASWGDKAEDYNRQKTQEIKEVMLLMAQAAESVGERDQRYSSQLNKFTEHLHALADLDDISIMRASLVQSAADIRSCVDRMAEDGTQSVAALKVQLVTYQERVEKAERLASIDPLTNLWNRRKIDYAIGDKVREALPFCVMLFDLNHFKEINDTFGHLAGDNVLKQFAQELKAAFRTCDTVGRWGGDEFVVLVEGNLMEAETYAQRVRQWVFGDYAVNAPGDRAHVKVHVEAAIGITQWSVGESIENLLARADKAMYAQKFQRGPARSIA